MLHQGVVAVLLVVFMAKTCSIFDWVKSSLDLSTPTDLPIDGSEAEMDSVFQSTAFLPLMLLVLVGLALTGTGTIAINICTYCIQCIILPLLVLAINVTQNLCAFVFSNATNCIANIISTILLHLLMVPFNVAKCVVSKFC